MFAHQEGEMEWVTVRVVGPRQEGVDQGAEHTLDNLTNSATYEAIVQVGQWGDTLSDWMYCQRKLLYLE